MFFYSGAEVGSWGWLSTYLTVDRGATLAAAGAAVSLLWGAVIAGRLVCGKLAHKFKSGKLVPLLAFITALALVLLAAAPGNLPVWPVILLVGLGYSSQWPFIAAYGASLHKEYSGASYALLIGSCGVGMSVIPGLLGIVGKKAGMRAAMGSPAVLLILVGAIFLFLNFKGGARE
jgi:FHS family glucose/mannose:H+ symporter-like MFS transporter